MTENEARQMEVEIKWNGKANVCIHCGKVPETYYIATGHDHTDDSIRYCFCRAEAQSFEQLQAKVAELEKHINELRNQVSSLKAELREICSAIDDPACDLTLTAVECIKKLKEENYSLRKDAERYRWLRDATGEAPLRPAAFGSEMYPDMRLKLDFPTIVSYDAVGNVTTLDQAIDAAMAKGEQ